MIILDTYVVSEPLRPTPDPALLAWLDRQQPATLYLTSVNVAELLAGVEALPIAAIAVAHGFAVATRNVRDFSATGVELINLWNTTA